ncbi:unnamed protein product [Psylliodes chrysocephalus]|uniref:BZIP domain-containing protein n=1 Tax=Psylliodes chrysocephalus TaxID=3402493 RepID=A0A9P0GIK4_9CUCU|nr:unnamed protein product [Psylliodes chrysocephala]
MNMANADNRRHLLGGESLDPASLICVNPYEVNPLSDGSDLTYATVSADIPLKVESSVSPQNQDGISCGGFYGPARKIKLEMEEFGDLSPFVPQKRTFSNCIDELNTPIFDKDAFDFDILNYEKNVHADVHVTLKYDTQFCRNGGGVNAADYQPHQEFNTNKDIFLNADSIMRRNVTILPLENIRLNETDANVIYSPPASENGTYIETMSPENQTVFDLDMNNSVSVNLSSRNSSPYGQVTPEGSEKSYKPKYYSQITPEGSEKSYKTEYYSQITPDASEKSYKTEYYSQITPDASEKSFKIATPGVPKLSMDINLANLDNQTAILDVSTPNLIAEVVNLEATGFNILDLINEDNLPITTDDIFSPTSHPYGQKSLDQSQKRIAVKQPRKRRSKPDEDDDDEDYVPPTKKSNTYRKKSRVIQEYSESDSEEEEDDRPRKKARGRPPKRRTESISSDCSLGRDGDGSKYRELRDKNNEASRKSRLKRKTKELILEQEADELNIKNIKLKAQVEELEKMVNNFRDNLFKIMINK